MYAGDRSAYEWLMSVVGTRFPFSSVSELMSCVHGHKGKEVRFVRYSVNFQHSGFVLMSFFSIFFTKKYSL